MPISYAAASRKIADVGRYRCARACGDRIDGWFAAARNPHFILPDNLVRVPLGGEHRDQRLVFDSCQENLYNRQGNTGQLSRRVFLCYASRETNVAMVAAQSAWDLAWSRAIRCYPCFGIWKA